MPSEPLSGLRFRRVSLPQRDTSSPPGRMSTRWFLRFSTMLTSRIPWECAVCVTDIMNADIELRSTQVPPNRELCQRPQGQISIYNAKVSFVAHLALSASYLRGTMGRAENCIWLRANVVWPSLGSTGSHPILHDDGWPWNHIRDPSSGGLRLHTDGREGSILRWVLQSHTGALSTMEYRQGQADNATLCSG